MSKNEVYVYGESNKKAFESFQQKHHIVDWNTFFTNLKDYKHSEALIFQDSTTHTTLTVEVLKQILETSIDIGVIVCPLYRTRYTKKDGSLQRFLAASQLDIIHTFANDIFVPNIQFYIKSDPIYKEPHAISEEETVVFITIFYLLGENINHIAAKYDLEPGIVELLSFVPAFMSKNPNMDELKTYFPKNKYNLFYNSQKNILYIDQITPNNKIISNEIPLGDIKDEILTHLSDHIRNFGLNVFDLYFNKKGSSNTEKPHALSLWNCYNLFKLLEKQHNAVYDKINTFCDMTEEELKFYCFHKENCWTIAPSLNKELERIHIYRENEQLFRSANLKSMYA